jgi:thiol-disulfide isomerase/thioredoxin
MILNLNFLRTLVSCLIAVAIFSQPGFSATDLLKKPKAPLPSLNGGPSFAGETTKAPLTVVQFWASWCTGCGVVMGQMSDLISNRTDVAYVTVSLDESKDVAMKFFGNKSEKTQQSINRSYLDASGASYAEQNGVESLPYLIMVDKQGKIVKRIKGHPSKSDLELLSKK